MDAHVGRADDNSAPPAGLGGLARGYEHYLEGRGAPSPVEWARTTVVLDTSVLLNLYRSPDGTREELLGALEAIAPSLFMPAQVQREFWRNRDSVLRENAVLDETANELRRMLRDAKKSLTRLGQGKIGAASAKDLTDRLESTLEEVIKAASSYRPSFDWRTALSASGHDTVLTKLIALYDGKVGPEFGPEDSVAAIAEASERFARRTPPGYMDVGKDAQDEEGAGDYLLWMQTMAHARRSGQDVLVVTQDAKEDWWRRDARNEPINARFELVDEMRREAGVGVRLVMTPDFIRIIGETTDSPVSERTVDEVDELAASTAGEDSETGESWTRIMLDALLERLRENGYSDRALVLLRALSAPSGVLSRTEVLAALGRGSDAKLTGFTRAIATATKQLIEEGVLPPVAEAALTAEYDGPGKAVRFAMPPVIDRRPVEDDGAGAQAAAHVDGRPMADPPSSP